MNDLFWNFFFFGARLLIFALALFALIDILVVKQQIALEPSARTSPSSS